MLKSRDFVVFRTEIEFLGRVPRRYFPRRKVVARGDFQQYFSRSAWKYPLKCRFGQECRAGGPGFESGADLGTSVAFVPQEKHDVCR